VSDPRLVLVTPRDGRSSGFARDVRSGLSRAPRSVPCCWFYDDEGSRLFDRICDLPEYYLTRCEREILEAHAADILGRAGRPRTLVELGCGSAAKTGLLLDVLAREPGPMRYVAVDIACEALRDASLRLLERYPGLEVRALATEYHEGLDRIHEHSQPPRLFLWMGSNVGNFHRAEAADFLGEVRECMADSDALLLGVDMRKDAAVLRSAYNDAEGVTARFNLNVLDRINQHLGGDFDRDAFDHRADWNDADGRIEMYLVSRKRQRVAIRGLDLDVELEAGERIHTENSYKYSQEELGALSAGCGLRLAHQWTDARGWFTVNLLTSEGLP